MQIPEKAILRTAILRSPTPADAESLLDILHITAGETAFLEALIAQAKALGPEILTLDHLESNVRPHRLYEKLGFVTVAEVPKTFRLPDGSYQKAS